jgi:acetylornithine deacetylase/succinyl-diaminopimelate desuccinylase-like protein
MIDFSEFDAYIDAHRDRFIQRLADLVRLPSVSAQGGPAMRQTAEAVRDLAQSIGLDARLVEINPGEPPFVVAEIGPADAQRTLMIYNHYDVQPPEPLELWTSPPFELVQRDGKLFGRGTADNKGNLTVRLSAIEAFRHTFGELPLRIVFVIEGEEEMGSPQMAQFSQQQAELLRQCDGCWWEAGSVNDKGQTTVTMGLKGLVALEFHAKVMERDSHSAAGGILPNAIWRLMEALTTLRRPDGTLTIDGLAQHLAPLNPGDLELIAASSWTEESVLRRFQIKELLGGRKGKEAEIHLVLHPCMSINGIIGGYTGKGGKTVIPCEATAKTDIRLVPNLTPELVRDLVRAHLDRRGFSDIHIQESEAGLRPAKTDPKAPIVQAAKQAILDATGKPADLVPNMAGSGPMYDLCDVHGIPTIAMGVAYSDSRGHAPDENIRIDDFVTGMKIAGRFFHAFAQSAGTH